jgi:fructokinase
VSTPDGLILVAGEALYDLVVESDDHLHGHPGGGPFNAARAIGRLEQPVAYLGRLSSDRFGRTLAGMLAEDGVRLDGVVRTDDPTTLALAELDPSGSAQWSFYERGTAAPGLTPQDALAALPSDVAILHVGTLGLILEPIATALEAVVEELADRALIAVDPNCRPSLMSDPVGYRSRLRRVLRNSHVVKVSDEDLAWLDPERPPLEAARAMLALGPAVVLVTRGASGAVVVHADGDIVVPAPQVTVVDTIGAGDAFGAGFLAWWRSHSLGRDDLADSERVVEATRFAALVAARTCERAGASPPRLAEVAA